MVNMSDEEEVVEQNGEEEGWVVVAENVEQKGEDEELPWEQKQEEHEPINWQMPVPVAGFRYM